MRISTNQFYQVNGEKMSAGQSKVAELQAKLGSGKQILKPSEDPSKSNLISGLEGAKSDKRSIPRMLTLVRRD